ncbi:SRPBCC domain-containing protein [Actinomadura darangshiensis]|uniref:SRPBCC domain-containing protein n=1 Tax=Actinomadura darangshiensis TaxID=705336 RepID=A0A4R5A3X9_9ACTN|nr:SRPBCC domain-containing protein [Actinomadura darangshiensis]TDD66551.1 SRPBCC domain-containing protein [Actinomadura darangshiensis]
MGKEFEIVREFEVGASPEQVWDAITTGTAGWLWPTEYEPREGGSASGLGIVTAWDPPHRLTSRVEDPDGIQGVPQTLNVLDNLIEPREGGGAWVRYVHSGIFTADWDDQYDGANRHTDFYLHTLRQYLAHFTGRQAVHSDVQGPEASMIRGSFEAVGRALGLGGAAEGDTVKVDLPGTGPVDAVLDYRNEHFIGLRTGDAMYRFFGRDAWGGPVGIALHRFGPDASASREKAEEQWRTWLTGLYA